MSNLESIDILGNSSIGIFATATNSYALFPPNIKDHLFEKIQSVLKVPIISTTLANCSLTGLFSVGNSSNLIVPSFIDDDEYSNIKDNLPDKVSLHLLDSKITALGNAIVSSDKVALVHPEFSKDDIILLGDYLDVEIIPRKILDSSLVGSLIFRNDRGLLTHPLIDYDEIDWLTTIFNIKGDVVTVNRGTPYPRPGIIGNNHGVLVGSDTTGPELMRIYEILLSN